MKPVLFKVGGLSFYTHGVFLVLAVLVSSLILYWLAVRARRKTEAVFDLTVFSLLCGIFFARLTYFLMYRNQFTGWGDLFRIWEGGLVSWGGFVAGILCFLVVIKIYKEPMAPWLDILGIAALAGIAIGRVGSFLSGELAGKSTSSFLAVRGIYPVTLIEAALLLLGFAFFLITFRSKKINRDGYYFVFIILYYALVRFALDFLRVDQVAIYGLTYSQIISAVLVIAAIAYMAISLWRSTKRSINA